MTRPADTPRDVHAVRIETIDLPQAKTFADFIRTGDASGAVPCWGALEERFVEAFKETADRLRLWNVLVETGDRRSLLIFIEQARTLPEVIAKVVADAHRLSPALQRAVVSLDEATEHLAKNASRLHPAARQLWEAGDAARCKERELMEARMGQLRAFRYFTPDSFDPAKEPGGRNPTGDTASRPDDDGNANPTPTVDTPGSVAAGGALVTTGDEHPPVQPDGGTATLTLDQPTTATRVVGADNGEEP